MSTKEEIQINKDGFIMWLVTKKKFSKQDIKFFKGHLNLIYQEGYSDGLDKGYSDLMTRFTK